MIELVVPDGKTTNNKLQFKKLKKYWLKYIITIKNLIVMKEFLPERKFFSLVIANGYFKYLLYSTQLIKLYNHFN